MCSISVVMDYGRTHIAPNDWTADKYRSFQELIEKARAFDEAAKQPDCHDPAKAEWMRAIEARIAALEAAASVPLS